MPYKDLDVTVGRERLEHSMTANETIAASGFINGEGGAIAAVEVTQA